MRRSRYRSLWISFGEGGWLGHGTLTCHFHPSRWLSTLPEDCTPLPFSMVAKVSRVRLGASDIRAMATIFISSTPKPILSIQMFLVSWGWGGVGVEGVIGDCVKFNCRVLWRHSRRALRGLKWLRRPSNVLLTIVLTLSLSFYFLSLRLVAVLRRFQGCRLGMDQPLVWDTTIIWIQGEIFVARSKSFGSRLF